MYLINWENNIIILGPNIFLEGREHQDKTNKICFTLFGALYNFIQIIQDKTCLCTKTSQTIPACYSTCAPSGREGRTIRRTSVGWVPETTRLCAEFGIELRTVRRWIADCSSYKIMEACFVQRLGLGGNDSRAVRP
jgi:hypothetical protein